MENSYLGCIILKKDSITFTFWTMKELRIEKPAGWMVLDGYDCKQHYNLSRISIQSIESMKKEKNSGKNSENRTKNKRLMAKYKHREQNRVNDIL